MNGEIWENEGGAWVRDKDDLVSEEVGVGKDVDPFSPENIEIVKAITMLRLYDATMAVLTKLDPEAASALYTIHAKGGLLSPPPAFDPEALEE